MTFSHELMGVHLQLYLLRTLQLICCFAAGACAVAPIYVDGVVVPVTVPSATLDFIAGSLTVLKLALQVYLGDKYLHSSHRFFVLDLVSAILMLGAGGNAAAYVKSLGFTSEQLVASYALSFVAAGLLFMSAVLLRRTARALANTPPPAYPAATA